VSKLVKLLVGQAVYAPRYGTMCLQMPFTK
jgi:hypothetical protein